MAIALNSGCVDSVVMIEAEPRFAVEHTRGIILPQGSRWCTVTSTCVMDTYTEAVAKAHAKCAPAALLEERLLDRGQAQPTVH